MENEGMLNSELAKKEPTQNGCPLSGTQTGNKKETIISLKNHINGTTAIDTLHKKVMEPMKCSSGRCAGSLMTLSDGESVRATGIPRPKEDVKVHAEDFLQQYYTSLKLQKSPSHLSRLAEVLKAIEETGTYDLTKDELTFGAKTAWRNAPRCIGRIQWNNLQVFDARHVQTAREMFETLVTYIRFATNKGNIRSGIVIFPQRRDSMKDFRVWNSQLIKYAGYKQEDGSTIGDPANVEMTELCEALGWQGKGGKFDILPLVLQANGKQPELFEIPQDVVLEVNIKHPRLAAFEEMNLKWFALPAVSSMKLDCGGVEFPGCPFNGWYMGTEIGRDFADVQRYNLLKPIALKLGLDTSRNGSLWKDYALIELNSAILSSYQDAGVTLVDHHTASEQFVQHMANEVKLRGGIPADWVWIVPPVSGGTTSVFHQEMLKYVLKPSFDYQADPWKVTPLTCLNSEDGPRRKLSFTSLLILARFATTLMCHSMKKRHRATILYATETGTSERYARTLGRVFAKAFNSRVLCMQDYSTEELQNEELVLVVTSTFGNGDSPMNGKDFANSLHQMCSASSNSESNSKTSKTWIKQKKEKKENGDLEKDHSPLVNIRYSVFGLGNKNYNDFCAFARTVDKQLKKLGGKQLLPMGEGDELRGQEQSFNSWASQVFKVACQTSSLADCTNDANCAVESLSCTSNDWNPDNFRFAKHSGVKTNLCEALSKTYGKDLQSAKVISVNNLQPVNSGYQTLLVRLSTKDEKLNYKPGDHVAIFPANRSEVVDALIDIIYDKPEAEKLLTIETCIENRETSDDTISWKPLNRIRAACTLKEALTRFLDISSTPAPQLLLNLATQTTDPEERESLQLLGKDSKKYDEWRKAKLNILDVIEDFPFLRISALFLLTQLPLLQPRLYSISSSPDMFPDELHLTVSVVQYNTQGHQGSVHFGVCSTWLKELKPGDIVPCYVREAHSFHMPDDHTVPIIMVGTGSGIAPLRSFWQQRAHDRKTLPVPPLQTQVIKASHQRKGCFRKLSFRKMFSCGCFRGSSVSSVDDNGLCLDDTKGGWGDLLLFSGCRNSSVDDIYKKEITEAVERGALTKVYKAYSREPGQPKCYVQDKLKQFTQRVCDTLISQNGHIFVCGSTDMAMDVGRTIQEILEDSGKMSASKAKEYFAELKVSGRYHEDVFGLKAC